MRVQFHSFRHGGFKVPVEPGDYFSLWNEHTHEECLQLDAAVVLEMLAARVREARIIKMILGAATDPLGVERLTLVRPPEEPQPKALMTPDVARRVLLSTRGAERHDAKLCGVRTEATGLPCRKARPCHWHPERTKGGPR